MHTALRTAAAELRADDWERSARELLSRARKAYATHADSDHKQMRERRTRIENNKEQKENDLRKQEEAQRKRAIE